MDILSGILFFLVVVPLMLIYFNNQRKADAELIALQKETNHLLAELLDDQRHSSSPK